MLNFMSSLCPILSRIFVEFMSIFMLHFLSLCRIHVEFMSYFMSNFMSNLCPILCRIYVQFYVQLYVQFMSYFMSNLLFIRNKTINEMILIAIVSIEVRK